MAEEISRKYRVVFKGDIEADKDIVLVKENLARIFKVPPDRIEKLFSGKPVILNSNLDDITAQNYASELQIAGATCTVEPMPEIQATQQDTTSKSQSNIESQKTDNPSGIRAKVSKNVEALTAFIPPSLFSKKYLLGWVLSASGMALLFCIYLFLILFAASTLFDHIVDNTSLIDDLPIVIGFLAYLTPIPIGILFIAAMLKPFFAPPMVKPFSIPLSRKKEPALFIFIEKLCRSIGHTLPANIEIDFLVDVSASYKRGLISFLEDNLTLSIGLPVVSEMTLQEFASLIAHEFAHFTDKTTTRLYYAITNVNRFFARVVLDQDLIDSKLIVWKDTASSIVFRLPLSIVILFIYLTKKICTLLLLAGHTISRYYVRQMEFDADRYSARIVGSDIFESAINKLHIIEKAMKESFLQLKKLKNRNDTSLPDNFVSLITSIRSQMTEEEITKAKESASRPKTGIFDSYPTDRERINRVTNMRAKGLFHSEVQSTTIFSNFEEIAKIVSARYYRESLRLRFDQNSLIPLQDYLNIPEQTVDIAKPESQFDGFN